MDQAEARARLIAGVPERVVRAAEVTASGAPSPFWEAHFSRLARQRAWELNRLADELQGVSVTFDLDQIMLDTEARELHLSGRLSSHGAHRPDAVWLFCYFLHPAHVNGSWSQHPFLVTAPFVDGDQADVSLQLHAEWVNSDVPKNGYRARVFAMGQTSLDARMPEAFRDYDLATAIPVASR